MHHTHDFATHVYFIVFLVLTPQTHEKTHKLHMYMYTFLYMHTCMCHMKNIIRAHT